MNNCPNCNSTNFIKKGTDFSNGIIKQRYKCKDCSVHFYDTPSVKTLHDILPLLGNDSVQFEEEYSNYNGIVVTSCLNNTDIFDGFLSGLEKYCNQKNYKLFVIGNRYRNPTMSTNDVDWPPEVEPYLLRNNIKYKDKFKIIGDCNIQATATNPLTGIDGICEGMTTIVGHPVVQMKSIAVNEWRDSIILHSTGSISLKNNYSASKSGHRAQFHHCFGAVVIDLNKSNDTFFIRQLLSDKSGTFHDLDEVWNETGFVDYDTIEAIYTGDEHVLFADKDVVEATYGDNGIVACLKPKYIIRGDIIDSYSISHHHAFDFFTRWKKNQITNNGSLTAELKLSIDHVVNTTPKFSQTLIVNSNHDDHIDKWLNISDPKFDYVNAEIYHQLMYLKLTDIRAGKSRSALQIYLEDIYSVDNNKVKFIDDGFSLHGITLSMHGSTGPNGSRGSAQNLSKIGERSIIGHSHTPSIIGGLFCVGTSSLKKMDYTSGPSSWLHTHCIIHKNGKRQLITIIGGKWRIENDIKRKSWK